MNENTKEATEDARPVRKPPSFLFRLVIPVTFVFVFTCFVMLTHDLLGDQNSKFAGVLRDHGTQILGWEAGAAIALAGVAMFADRIKTLRTVSEGSTDDAENGSGTLKNVELPSSEVKDEQSES